MKRERRSNRALIETLRKTGHGKHRHFFSEATSLTRLRDSLNDPFVPYYVVSKTELLSRFKTDSELKTTLRRVTLYRHTGICGDSYPGTSSTVVDGTPL